MNRKDLRNSTLNVAGEALWGFQAFMIAPATALTVLLLALGGGAETVGWVAAIESGAMVLPQVVGVFLFRSRRRRKVNLLVWHFVVMLPILFVMSLATGSWLALPPATLRLVLLACFACFTAAMGAVTPGWLDWLAHIFDRRIRGTVIGLGWAASSIAGAGGALLAGRMIGPVPQPATYSLLYLLAGGIGTLSIALFIFIDDSDARTEPEPPPLRLPELLRSFRLSLGDRNFRRFLLARVVSAMGFCIVPFLAKFYTSPEGGGIRSDNVVSFGAALTVGMAASGLSLGRLGDACGHRLGCLLVAGAQVATLATALLTSGPWSCLVAYFLAGFCLAAFVPHQNMLFETCRHENRMAHIALGNLVLALGAIAAPLIGGAAAERWGIKWLFAGCLAFSLLGLLLFALTVKEPRRLAVQPARGDYDTFERDL